MVKVLSIGENPYISTGYGQIWENLLKRWTKLKPDWEFHHLGWQTRDRKHMTAEGYYQHPNTSGDAYAWGATAQVIIKEQPDILITMCDVGYQSGYMEPVFQARKLGWTGKWLAYTPLDSHKWETLTWHKFFDIPDVNVAMAEFGAVVMKLNNVENVVLIPSGVNLEDFHPMNKEEVKERFNLKGKFVAGFVGKNQRRKMIDVLLKSWKTFSEDKEDVCLVLHTDQEPVQGADGWSIPYLIENYGLREKVKLTKNKLNVETRQMTGVSEINSIYNVMDVFAFPTGGEGFGLPMVECQAAGVPLLTGKSTTGFELTNNGTHAWLVPILKDKYGREVTIIGTNSVEFSYVDDILFTAQLNKIYEDWKNGGKYLQLYSLMSRDYAQQYHWDPIAKRWTDLFDDVLK
jgi:glycosyltransferase involved in cell wall biosynthesis